MSTPSMSCPSGGEFYACASSSRFVGCCGLNPCGGNGCAEGNLEPTSFDPAEYAQYPDQECSAGLFYTCSATDPPFWGCCSTNPCSAGECSFLEGAYLSNNPAIAAPFLALNGTADTSSTTAESSTTASSTTTSTSSSATSSDGATNLDSASTSDSATSSDSSTFSISTTTSSAATSTSQAALPSATNDPSSQSPTNVGAIAGGAVGGFAVIAILILGLIWLLRRRRNTPDIDGQVATAEAQQYQDSPKVTKSEAVAPGMYSPTSTAVPPYPGSPHLPISPGLPSYVDGRDRPVFQELPGSPVGEELDSGQRYHPYRPVSGPGIDRGRGV